MTVSRVRSFLSMGLRRTALLVAVMLTSVAAWPPALEAQVPTQSQIEAFRNLPPDQQRALMEQLGLGGSAATRSQQLEFPATMEPKGVAGELDEDQLQRLREPRLRAGEPTHWPVSSRKVKLRRPVCSRRRSTSSPVEG